MSSNLSEDANTFRIVFLGLIGTGKSYVAKKSASITRGEVLAFAKDVYFLAENVLGRPVDKAIESDRMLLKTIGTDWGRNGFPINPSIERRLEQLWKKPHGYSDMWFDTFVRHVDRLGGICSIFNDDTRFPNELSGVLGMNFTPIFITCSEETRQRRLAGRGEVTSLIGNPHISEMMTERLCQVVMTQRILPVLWNDSVKIPVQEDWIITVDDFFRILQRDGVTVFYEFVSRVPLENLKNWLDDYNDHD
jgi:hypothetical protein